MPSHTETTLVPFSADFMYGLVADVESYPKFVPWCADLKIKNREKTATGEELIAETTVGFKSFSEKYTSKVTLNPSERTIDVVQTEGVFRELENHWKFVPQGDHCLVDFNITYEFKSSILGFVADTAFGHVLLRMNEAFE